MENKNTIALKIFEDVQNKTKGMIRNDDCITLIYDSSFIAFIVKKYKIKLPEGKDDDNEEFLKKLKGTVINNKMNANDLTLVNDVANSLSGFMYCNNLRNIIEEFINLTDNELKEIMKTDLEEKIDLYTTLSNPTNKNIAELAYKILEVKDGDEIIDICSGMGSFMEVCYENNENQVSGIDINERSNMLSRIRFAILEKNYNIRTKNILTCKIEKKYDKVFSQFPWGVRIDREMIEEVKKVNYRFKWSKVPANSSDWFFVNAAISRMKENGKAIVIIPDGPLYKIADIQIKKDICESGLLETIIKLPSGILGTNISLNFLIFSNKNKKINFIDASQKYKKENNTIEINTNEIYSIYKSKENENKRTETIEEIGRNEYDLDPFTYVGKKEIKLYNPQKLSKYIKETFRGYQITAKELRQDTGDEEYEILSISDIEDETIVNDLQKVKENKGKLDRYLLKNKDLIITAKGTKIKTLVIENIGERKIVANGNLLVIRLDTEKVNPFYIEAFLNSSNGKKILNWVQTGRVILSINPNRMKEVEVPGIDMEQQNVIGKKYRIKIKQVELERRHLEQLQDEKNNFFDKEEELFEQWN